MRIAVPKETDWSEPRVAATPETVKKFRGLGAEVAVTGEIQKVSNLILSVNLHVRDAETGATARAGAVDIRGNTDDSFRRGYSYLLRNLIFREK